MPRAKLKPTEEDRRKVRTMSACGTEPDEIAKVRKTVIRYAADDKSSDFVAAEQVVMGMDSLSYAFGDHEKRKAALDALYNAVRTANSFDPKQFADVARGLLNQF